MTNVKLNQDPENFTQVKKLKSDDLEGTYLVYNTQNPIKCGLHSFAYVRGPQSHKQIFRLMCVDGQRLHNMPPLYVWFGTIKITISIVAGTNLVL